MSRLLSNRSTLVSTVPTVNRVFANQATIPISIAHRCGANIFPEETFEAASGALALGDSGLVLDWDANLLSDGAVGMMHDDTVDRTTTATGTTTSYTTQQWLNLQNDAGSWFAPGWPSNLRVPLVGEVLDRFGGKVPLSIEAKTTSTVAPLIREITRRGLQKSCLINTQIISDLATVKAAGIHASYYFPNAAAASDAPTRASVLAAAPNSIVVQTGTVLADLDTIVAWGIPVLAGQTDRRSDWATFRAHGCMGVVTDEPAYTRALNTPRTSDSWTSKMYGHGFLSNYATRPLFVGTNAIEFPAAAADRNVLVGEVAGNSPNKTFTMGINPVTLPTDMTRYFQFTFLDADNQVNYSATPTSNGYAVNFRANGNLELYKVTAGSASTLLTSKSTGVVAYTANGRRQVRVAFTGSGITVTDVTGGTSITSADTTYRPAGGWNFTIGRADSAVASVWDVDTLTVT